MKPTDPSLTPGSKKIFDVMRPGKAPASPTSKPVILNGVPVKDSQFSVPSKKGGFSSNASAVPELEQVAAELTGSPADAATPVLADETPSDVSTEDLAKGLAPADAEITSKNELEPSPKDELKAPVNPFSKEAPHPNKQEEAEEIGKAALDAAKVEDVEDLAAWEPFRSKKTIVARRSGSTPRSKIIQALLVVFILILLWVIVDIMLDLGWFRSNVIPHTDFL